jgi:hypothetical protein
MGPPLNDVRIGGGPVVSRWDHLIHDDAYASKKRILGALTLVQVNHVVSEETHTIHDELWHANRWQSIIVHRDQQLYATWESGIRYPGRPAASEREWTALVGEFLAGLETAAEVASSNERLAEELAPGLIMADALDGVAVHNAYHLGKIVAIRQVLGAWRIGESGR